MLLVVVWSIRCNYNGRVVESAEVDDCKLAVSNLDHGILSLPYLGGQLVSNRYPT